jgi:chromatin segregation and condensation protein Rec8/ScpA/Scc1 (kleisin family)
VEDLQNRLKAYEKIRNLSIWVKASYGAAPIYAKNGQVKAVPVFSPLSGMDKPGILAAIRRVIANLPKKESLPKALVRKVMSLEEMIGTLTERIKTGIRMSFKDFSGAGGAADKVTIIVSFLAMLELVKQGVISVKQEDAMGDIEMENGQVGTPNYS